MEIIINTKFLDSGISPELNHLYEIRAQHSKTKLVSFISAIANSPEIKAFENISIYCTGSYARLEASEHSDIDLFFITDKGREEFGDNYNVPYISIDGICH